MNVSYQLAWMCAFWLLLLFHHTNAMKKKMFSSTFFWPDRSRYVNTFEKLKWISLWSKLETTDDNFEKNYTIKKIIIIHCLFRFSYYILYEFHTPKNSEYWRCKLVQREKARKIKKNVDWQLKKRFGKTRRQDKLPDKRQRSKVLARFGEGSSDQFGVVTARRRRKTQKN